MNPMLPYGVVFWFTKPKPFFYFILNVFIALCIISFLAFNHSVQLKSKKGVIRNLEVDFSFYNNFKSHYATFEVPSLEMKFYMNLNESNNEQETVLKVDDKMSHIYYEYPHKKGFSRAAEIRMAAIQIGNKELYLERKKPKPYYFLSLSIIVGFVTIFAFRRMVKDG